MIYVMSDLHGCYEKYIEMLELIKFNDNDKLYIIGDICDRGKEPMKILLHMLEHDNIIPICGNHDVKAFTSLSKIGIYSNEVIKDRDYVITHYLMNHEEYMDYLYWLSDGGKETLLDYNNLLISSKRKIIDYLSDFKYYEELNINNINYVLIHGGFINFDVNKPLYEYKLNELIYERLDYNKTYYSDKIIISGHTPTKYIDKNYEGKIYKNNNHMAIDCGCVFGYKLGCLCLDNMEEYYV